MRVNYVNKRIHASFEDLAAKQLRISSVSVRTSPVRTLWRNILCSDFNSSRPYWSLKVMATCSFETSESYSLVTQRHILEERNIQILCYVDRASWYNSCKWPAWRTILFFSYMFITILYMFRALTCSSSGELEWHIPNVVLIQLILLMMCTWVLETCRDLE